MRDVVEAPGDIRVQHEFRLIADSVEDGFFGILSATAWAKPITVWFKVGFPFGQDATGANRNYAACFPLVTSFHTRKRHCKMGRYDPAFKRGRCGWKCSEMGPKAERKRWARLADLDKEAIVMNHLGHRQAFLE